jgi:CheY-like chemotaxis protein
MKSGSLAVLSIDDDEQHNQLLREAATADPRQLELRTVTSGEEGLHYLRESGAKPDIIFLDYNLQGRDGVSILAEIRADLKLKVIPVMMLSSAADVAHVRRAYETGVNAFFPKPATLTRYREFVALILTLWAGFAELPSVDPV